MKTLLKIFLPPIVLALGACNTIDSRIHEKAPLFNSLDAQTQAKIAHGDIALGFTPDMVYIALGDPNEKRQHQTAKGASEVWIYNTYYDRYEGSVHVGYHRWVVPEGLGYRVYWSPVYQDVYSEQAEQRIRVTFRDGKVVSIDQAKDS